MKIFLIIYILISLPIITYSQDTIKRIVQPYGICSHISRKGVDWDIRKEVLNILQETGINYVRTDFDWSGIQRNSNAKIDLTHLDAMMKSIDSSSVNVLPILDYNISGYNPAWKYLVPWNNYVNTLLQAYPNIKYWEVWNEMNLKNFWDNPSAKNYITLLSKTYQTIKEIDKNKKVLLGGLAGVDEKYLIDFFENGGNKYFDIMNFHYYPGTNPEIILKQIEKLKQIMNRYNCNKPIWITETGYHTAESKYSNLYNEIIPQIFTELQLNPDSTTIGYIYDANLSFYGAKSLNRNDYIKSYPNRKFISLEQLKKLNPKEIPVLFPTDGESFPINYWNYLVEYVKKGGTIVFVHGVPAYYNYSLEKETNGNLSGNNAKNSLKQLHASVFYSWEKKAKELKAPSTPTLQTIVNGYTSNYKIDLAKHQTMRYLTENNLKDKDQFKPILLAGDENYMGTIMALYRLNSDLKGNVIIHTGIDTDNSISENKQAERLPRLYILAFSQGIEKVFWYNFRAKENNINNPEDNYGITHSDLSSKPALNAYKTLVKMCPDGSEQPHIEIKNGIYTATWKQPNNTKVTAIWTENKDIFTDMDFNHYKSVYNYLGKKITLGGKIMANPQIIYLIE